MTQAMFRQHGGSRFEPPVGECLVCGHVMQLGVWKQGDDTGSAFGRIGVCTVCRDLAAVNRGACSDQRGCLCKRDTR